jgi:hypothetical protein
MEVGTMKTLVVALAAGGIALGAMADQATAAPPVPDTFIVVMNADNEVPHCGPSTDAARGVAIFHVTNEATGAVAWQLVAENLPGTITAAHIHHAVAGVAGPVVQPLPPTSGDERGVIGTGTFTNPTLLAAIRATPAGFYVNVHSTVCPTGVIRGQFGDHGP